MKKKDYLAPEIRVRKLRVQHMVCTSTGSSEAYGSESTMDWYGDDTAPSGSEKYGEEATITWD